MDKRKVIFKKLTEAVAMGVDTGGSNMIFLRIKAKEKIYKIAIPVAFITSSKKWVWDEQNEELEEDS